MTIQNEAKWEATHLRITVFPSEELAIDQEKLWPNLPEFSLEESKSKPKTLETTLEGAYNDKKVTVVALPIKIDLVIRTFEEPPIMISPEPSIPTIGEFPEVTGEFLEIANSWLKQIGVSKFNRIAFGAEVIKPVGSVEEGYKVISSIMPFEVSSKDSSDFRLQINKHTKYKVDAKRELKINRLTTFDVPRRTLQLVAPNQIAASFEYPETVFSHVVMDVNIAPDQGDFDVKESYSIFADLVAFGKDIISKGLK